MWWKVTTRTTNLNWNTLKNDFFKRFEYLKEKDFFAKLTRLQQKGDVDEYTDEWESLETCVPELINIQRLQNYVYRLKLYIRDELELLNVSTLDKVRRKEKIIKEKLKKMWNKNHDKDRRSIQNTKTDTKYQPPHLRSDNKPTL